MQRQISVDSVPGRSTDSLIVAAEVLGTRPLLSIQRHVWVDLQCAVVASDCLIVAAEIQECKAFVVPYRGIFGVDLQ